MKQLVSYESEAKKLNSYADWIKFLNGATAATDKMLGFGFNGATEAAEAEGITADFTHLKIMGKQIGTQQIENVIKFYKNTKTYKLIAEKFPILPQELPAKSSTYILIPGKTDIEKADNFEEVTKAYLKDVTDGKIARINVKEKGLPLSLAASKRLVSEITKSNTDLPADITFTPTPGLPYIRAYFKAKDTTEKTIAKSDRPKPFSTPKAKKMNPFAKKKAEKYGWDFNYSDLPMCKEAELREQLKN